ncbi:MAG: hypothetical protein ACKPE6_17580 [Gammaproteobacteria bacterium]
MLELMTWLEASALSAFLRGLNIWAYGLINLIHILGISTLFGAVLLLDLKLMGVWRSIPLQGVIRPTVPLAAVGFILAAGSGSLMFSFNTTNYHGNPFLYVKLPVIVFALLNVAITQRLAAWQRAKAGAAAEPGDNRVLALCGALSLLTWTTVVTCGRMIGYW